MADTTDTTAPDDVNAQLSRILAQLTPQQNYAPPAPVDRSIVSLLGEAVGGGTTGLSPADREAAGRRALLNFGANLSAASDYSTIPHSFGALFAQGVGGAQQSLAGSEAVSAARLGAQQAYEEKQQELQIAKIREAIPLLQMQQTEKARRALLGGDGAQPPGTSIAAAGGDGTFEGTVGALEGSGKSTTSTAAGFGQFIEPTWNRFVAANPDLFKGMTPEQVLAARDNPAIARQAVTWLAQTNAPALIKAGVAPSGPSLALAHNLGPAAAAAVMQAPENAPLVDVLTASIGKDQAAAYVKANPQMANATAGSYRAKYASVPAPGFLTPATASGRPGAPAAAPTTTAPAAAPAAPGAPATAPPVVTDQPPSAGFAGPGAPSTARVAAVSPAVPGDVNAIIRGMTAAGADATTLAPPGAPPAPVQVAGPGAPTAPASEALPLADAMAKAKATGQPVSFQGGNGAVVTPQGTVTMPSSAAVQTPPPPSRVPDTFVPAPVPIPPDVQQRIDHPEKTPGIEETYLSQVRTAVGPDVGKQMQEAQVNKANAIAKVRAEAIAQAQTIREKGEAQQQETWKVLRAEQAAREAAAETRQKEIEAATLAHTRALETETLKNREAQINSLRDAAIKADDAVMTAYRNDRNTGQDTINRLRMLRSAEEDMPESGSQFFQNHKDLLNYFIENIGLPADQLRAFSSRELYQRLLTNLATQMSQKSAIGPGTARSAEIQQNLEMLPSLATDHEGRLLGLGLIQNVAEDQVRKADAAEEYRYKTDHPDKSLDLHQSLFKFEPTYQKDHPSIIPRAPRTGPTEKWLSDNVNPGMVYERWVPQVDPLTKQPMLDANRRPVGKWIKDVRLEDQ